VIEMNLMSVRADPEAATAHLSEVWPEAPLLRTAAAVVARSIRYAHGQAPASWELTLFRKFLRLNVGQIAVLELFPDDLVLYTVAGRASGPRSYRRLKFRGYRAVDVRTERWAIPLRATLTVDREIVRRHRELIGVAARAKRTSPFKNSHCPGANGAIERLANCKLPTPEYAIIPGASVNENRQNDRSNGGVFGPPEQNAEVEHAAVEIVTSRMKTNGWVVRSVEREGCGYDLDCHRRGQVRHIEVKGTRGNSTRFVITAGEVRRADSDPDFSLVLVGNALTQNPTVEEWLGGSFDEAFQLEPLQFIARRTRA